MLSGFIPSVVSVVEGYLDVHTFEGKGFPTTQ